ncbi:MAG: hypothetical protein IPK99_10280 [Flavobacteriales bacterium]|nr:hypothetical protein [Flavobacteriales bacterium]
MAWREVDRIVLSPGRIAFDRTLVRSGTYFFTLNDGGHLLQKGKLVVL